MNPKANLFAGVMIGGGFIALRSSFQPISSPLAVAGICFGVGVTVLIANAYQSVSGEMEGLSVVESE